MLSVPEESDLSEASVCEICVLTALLRRDKELIHPACRRGLNQGCIFFIFHFAKIWVIGCLGKKYGDLFFFKKEIFIENISFWKREGGKKNQLFG